MIIAASVLLFATGQGKRPKPQTGLPAKLLEGKVRKAWEDHKNKIKDGFAVILADGFREVKEDSNGFADKKAIFEEMDHFELNQYYSQGFRRQAGLRQGCASCLHGRLQGKIRDRGGELALDHKR